MHRIGSLLLHLTNYESSPNVLSTLESELDQSIAPEEFCSTARTHGVGPLVYNALTQLPQGVLHGQLPEWIRRSMRILRPDAFRTSLATHRATLELSRLLDAAEGHGIRPVLIKGLSVSAHYPRPDVRIFGDLDLLVAERSIDAMVDIAFELGYVYGEWTYERGKVVPWLYSEEEIALTWQNDKKHIPCLIVPDSSEEPFRKTLEIHRNVVRPSCREHFDVVGALKRASKGTTTGVSVRTFDRADALWHQALHMYQFPENVALALGGTDLKLAWFRDIKALLAKGGIAETLLDRVNHPEAQYACASAIINTEDLYPGTIDESTYGAWRERFAHKPGNQLFEDLDDEGRRTHERGRMIGRWSRDIRARIFDERRLTEVFPHWWSLGRKAEISPFVRVARERMRRLGLPWTGATGSRF